jgi:hypothetical protein
MPYLNSRLHALVAMGLLLLTAPSLLAQDETSVVSTEIRGDVDGDGSVTAADAEALRAYLVRGTVPAGRSILPAGDANADGRVTAADAALISRYAAGADMSRFPVGRAVGDEGGGRIPTTDGTGSMLTLYECSVSVRTSAASCRPSSSGGAGSMMDIIVGKDTLGVNGMEVTYKDTVSSRGNPANQDTTTITFTLHNRLPFPVGTSDGVTPHPDGTRLFFISGPTADSGAYSKPRALHVRADNAQPKIRFTSAQNPTGWMGQYYQYDGVMQENDSLSQPVRFVYDARVTHFVYEMLVATPVQAELGRVTISPATPPVIGPTQTTQLTATVLNYRGETLPGEAVTWSTANSDIATVNSATGLVTGVAGGTATITASWNSTPSVVDSVVVQVIEANPDALVTTTGNVRIDSDSTSPRLRVTENDTLHGAAITFAGYGPTANKTLKGGDIVMDLDSGTFTYNPPAGFEGVDSLEYTITIGSASSTGRVALPVAEMIWFVGIGGAAPCDPNGPNASNVCGRLTDPYPTLADFQADNDGSLPLTNPKAGDAIFLYEGAHPGSVTLLASQMLVGQDAGASFESITGIDPLPGSDALPPMNPTVAPVTITGASGGVVLGLNNLARGFGIITTGGTALAGTNFGTPTIAEIRTISATGGAAMVLDNGTLNSTFDNVRSTGSTGRGISLTNVNGTPTFTAGNISGSAQAALLVNGGNVGFTWPDSISQANSAPLVDVQGSHSGTLVFSGTLEATNGAGLQFSAALGTYTFNGTTTLNGGDAAVDITNASTGTFTFGPNTLVQNPTSTAFTVNGSTPLVTFNGSLIRTANNALLVDITNNALAAGKSIVFDPSAGADSLYATIGDGIQLSNVDGPVDFNGRVRLAGGNAGVDIINGSSGNIDFDAATIVNPTGEALRIFNGSGGDQAADVSFIGAITTNAGRPVLIEDVSSGTVAVAASINTTAGLGLLVQNNTGGTFTFSHATQTLNTAGNAAVSLLNNTGATIDFTGGNLDIDVTSGAGFTATGGGTVQVQGANNSVNATVGGTAVNIANTSIGGSGVTFLSVNAIGGGTNGIVLSNAGSGAFQVTGGGASDLGNTTRGRTTARAGGGSLTLGAGGTITGKSGDGVTLNTTGPVTLRNMVITNGSADGIDAATVSGLVLDNLQVTGHVNNRGVSAASTSGLKIFHSEINSNATSAASGTANLYNLQLLDVTGTDSIMSTALHTSYGFVMHVANNSGTLNLRVENTQITGATNGIAAGIYPAGSSNVTANFQNDSIGHTSARGLQAGTGSASSAVLNLTVNGTAFRNNYIGIDAAHGSGGTYTFNITNNNLQTNVVGGGMAINVNRLGSPTFNSFGLFTGTVSGNIIGTAATANSGSDAGSGIEVESNGSGGITRVAIVNNTIRQVGVHGIYVAVVDGNIGGTAPPTLEARIASNTIANLDAVALDGIHVLPGALNTDDVTMCVDIANNTATGIRNGLRVRPSGLPAAPSTIQLEGWDGVTARATYFSSRPNTLAGGTAAYAEGTPSAPGGFVAVANCNTP